MLFRHVLVPLDFSEKNVAALVMAGDLAQQGGASVTLLHVIEPLAEPADDEIRAFYDSLRERARDKIATHRDELIDRGVATETAVTIGKRASEIVDFAVRENVDLVVLSSEVLDPDTSGRAPWPTISHRVALLAPMPVLLVR